MAEVSLSADKLRLKAELLYSRQGVLPFAAALFLLLAILIGVLVVPGQIAAQDSAKKELEALSKQQLSQRAKPGLPNLSPAQSLARVLADPQTTNSQIRALIDFAAASGLTVMQSDYRRIADTKNGTHSSYSQLQIALPVKGDYVALRRFIFSALSEMPSLSLDQLIIKREQASGAQVEAQLVMSLWQKPPLVISDSHAEGASK